MKSYKNDIIIVRKMEKLYSLTRILEVTENDFIEALRSSISDYEDAVVKYMKGEHWNEQDHASSRNE